ncbi:hypothetical protein Tco_0343209 [Tanacetum coccineum]
MPQTDFIDISSNESSPIQNHSTNTSKPLNSINATLITILDTTLALTIPPPTSIQTIPTQEPMVSPLSHRPLTFSTPSSSPLETYPYLSSLNELPPRSSNPLPQTLSQGLSQTLPQPTFMDIEPSFPPFILSRSRLSAQPEPFLSREQVLDQLSQYQDFDRHIEKAIQNAQNVQNSLLPSFTTTSQMPPQYHFTTTSSTTIPPFRSSLPPSSTFVPLDQSLWIEGPPIPPLQEHTCPHCQCTKTIVNNLQNEIRFMLNHILEPLNHLLNQQR